MKVFNTVTIASTLLLVAPFVQAERHHAIGIKGGATGAGIEYITNVSDQINIRLGVNGFNYDKEFEKNGINYDGRIELRSASLAFDYHPWNSGFRLSIGAYYNGNKVNANAKAINGEFIFNGDVYKVEDVGSATGDIDFNEFAPYLSIGWASAPLQDAGWAFTAEAGAFYHGKPEIQFNVTCGAKLSTAQCSRLIGDIRVEQDKLQQDINDYEWFPVVTIGLQYKF
ncbi:MAG: hypothetical protein ACPGUD_04850 [Parashewanella sp.]